MYTDARADEIGMLLTGRKKMIIRGAAGRKMPFGRVNRGDSPDNFGNMDDWLPVGRIESVKLQENKQSGF